MYCMRKEDVPLTCAQFEKRTFDVPQWTRAETFGTRDRLSLGPQAPTRAGCRT